MLFDHDSKKLALPLLDYLSAVVARRGDLVVIGTDSLRWFIGKFSDLSLLEIETLAYMAEKGYGEIWIPCSNYLTHDLVIETYAFEIRPDGTAVLHAQPLNGTLKTKTLEKQVRAATKKLKHIYPFDLMRNVKFIGHNQVKRT